MEFFFGSITWRRSLNISRTLKYIDRLNEANKLVYQVKGIRGTPCIPAKIVENFNLYGNLRLCFVPLQKIPSKGGNKKRVESVKELFEKVKGNLAQIPPIILGRVRNGNIFTMDGMTRVGVAKEFGAEYLLGYVHEDIISEVEGVREVGWFGLSRNHLKKKRYVV